MPPESILCERRGETTLVTLNRKEKLNALDAASVDSLLHIVEAAAYDGTRLLVLRGKGRGFSTGFGFSGFEQSSEGDLLLRFVRLEQLLQTVHMPHTRHSPSRMGAISGRVSISSVRVRAALRHPVQRFACRGCNSGWCSVRDA